MKRFVAILLAALCLFFSGCNRLDRTGTVVVIHSYDESGEDGEYFRKTMDKAFREMGRKPEVIHIYENLIHATPRFWDRNGWSKVWADSVRALSPDVILVNDDLAFRWMLSEGPDRDIFQNVPVVFAGVTSVPENVRETLPRITGFSDPVDLLKNCEILNGLTGRYGPTVELDPVDSLLVCNLREQMAQRPDRFVDNTDLHIYGLDKKAYESEDIGGKFVVSSLCNSDPVSNVGPGTRKIRGAVVTSTFYYYARINYQIQVKHDVWANFLVARSRMPQFTAIREGFNDPNAIRFLCGYFADTRTQIEDQVTYACRILDGASVSDLPIRPHMKAAHMDYNAMRLFNKPLKYSHLKNDFRFVNVPLRVAYPTTWILIVMVLVLLGVLALAWVFFFFIRRKNAGEKEKLAHLQREEEIRNMALGDSLSAIWSIRGDSVQVTHDFAVNLGIGSDTFTLEWLRSRISEDSLQTFDRVLQFRGKIGPQQSMRLKMGIDKDHLHWWNVIFTPDTESAADGVLSGLITNIDETVAAENGIREAMDKAGEVLVKEGFIANISHDIRTPLNSITGFARLLSREDLSDEDRHQFSDIIMDNTNDMLSMLDDIVCKSSGATDRMSFKLRPISVRDIVHSAYDTNRILAPSNIEFRIENCAEPMTVNADPIRLRQVMNNFLSNAFKFTLAGSVVLGYRRMEDKAEIYVIDTGIGIRAEDKEHIFSRYSKVSENDRGTGLGLDICKSIVEYLGGQMGVESALGQGSRFWFTLPLVEEKEDGDE